MATTTNGVPYPAGTSALSTWAAVMLSLAQFVDDRLNTRCKVYQTATTNMAVSGTTYAIGFDTENTDAKGLHDPVTNNSRITISTQGRYELKGQVTFAANAAGYRYVELVKNGATLLAATRIPSPSGAATCPVQVVASEKLNPGDYVELRAAQLSGGALASVAGLGGTFLDATLTGAA